MSKQIGVCIDQNEFHKAVIAGIQTGEYQFALSLVERWLEKYPQDIEAEVLEAQILINKRITRKGKAILEHVLDKDPENIQAIRLLKKIDPTDSKFYNSVLFMLIGEAHKIRDIHPWATFIRSLHNEIRKNNFKNAEKLLLRAIHDDPDNIYVALEHAKLFIKMKDAATNKHLLKIYTNRWPSCIAFKLFSALNFFKSHEESESLALLHECSRLDPGGVLARKIFGSDHAFLSIFTDNQTVDYLGDIPTSVAITFKWTQLPSGHIANQKSFQKDEILHKSLNTEEMVITPPIDHAASTEKIYVILTSYIGLKEKYGPKTTEVVLEQLENLAGALEKNPRWKPLVFIPDKADCVENLGLTPLNEIDPWKIKLAIMDLNTIIKKSNASIGAILIVGNHDVVPFHRLPNPTEDSDPHVLSDNPYATATSNYLLPEWIIGRLPGEAGNDPGLLIEQLRHIIGFHTDAHHSQGFVYKIIQLFKRLRNFGRFIREIFASPNDFGYSAEVWRRSSIAAFRPIGKGADLRVSPPFENETIDVDRLLQAKCVYFNLHGLSTTNEWYGQRDFSENPAGPDFPVAITADLIQNVQNNIDLVFTEACYGGYIFDKKIEESMTLKLLAIGSQGVVGSSCIAYGSVFTPLIGADLLAFIFWKYIKDGYSFGDALRQAKVGLIKVMMQRQGYLDGEDQKTLLSFNLYGDPLGCLEEIIFMGGENENGIHESDLTLVNDNDGILGTQDFSQQSLTKDIKEVLDSYLPGLETAKMRVRKQKVKLEKMLDGNNSLKIGSNLDVKNITQIMYEKTISVNKLDHLQFARVTIDEAGKVIKLAISR